MMKTIWLHNNNQIKKQPTFLQGSDLNDLQV